MTSVTRPSVRAATVRDAADLQAIHVRSWQAAHQSSLPQDYLDKLVALGRMESWRSALTGTDWPRAGIVVAAPDREVVGFARFRPSRDEDDDASEVGQIGGIYLLPEAWGMGLGKRLMCMALARLISAGYSQATLWVQRGNVRARRFYEIGGWTADGAAQCDDRFGFPMDEIRYRKQLRCHLDG
jgi:ribosomal protein S18 acetylase RimI-like enzyme